jgi:hypothetical protein
VAKLPLFAWLANAAAVLSGRRGAPTAAAKAAGCSRQTVYDHADRLAAACAAGIPDPARVACLEAENAALRAEVARLGAAAPVGEDRVRRFAVTAEAAGVSLRQAVALLETLLPEGSVPSRAKLGRWTAEAGRAAAAALAPLDAATAAKVRTLAVDEIFLGGSRPSSGSSRPA